MEPDFFNLYYGGSFVGGYLYGPIRFEGYYRLHLSRSYKPVSDGGCYQKGLLGVGREDYNGRTRPYFGLIILPG